MTCFETLASEMGYSVEWVGPFLLLRLSRNLHNGMVDGTIGFNRKCNELLPRMKLSYDELAKREIEAVTGKLNDEILNAGIGTQTD